MKNISKALMLGLAFLSLYGCGKPIERGYLEQDLFNAGIKKVSKSALENPNKLKKRFIYVGAEWCGICQLKASEVVDLKDHYKKIKFSYLDGDDTLSIKSLEKMTGKLDAVPVYVIFDNESKPTAIVGYSEDNKKRMCNILDSLSAH